MYWALRKTGGGNMIDIVGHSNQFHYYLSKWCNRNWWDYGVSLRGGWLTEDGVKALTDIENAFILSGQEIA